jgi:uncharacterized membrane protein YbhN (UPF0104 family)
MEICVELFVCFWFVGLSVCRPVCGPVGQSAYEYTLFAAVSLVSFDKLYVSKFRNTQKLADSDDPIKVLQAVVSSALSLISYFSVFECLLVAFKIIYSDMMMHPFME